MLLIALWYAASVVCNQTSKVLVQTVSPKALTLAQMVIATACGALTIFGFKAAPFDGITSLPQLKDVALLAAIYSAGFTVFNACFEVMHVSMIMVLRAAEPLSTLLLGLALIPRNESGGSLPRPAVLTALMVVVGGCGLSAIGEYGPTKNGLLLAWATNILFSVRGILGKKMFAVSSGKPQMGPYSLFLHLTWMGVILQVAMMAVQSLLPGGAGLAAALPPLPTAESLHILLLNGVSFYTYLQLSWVCLGRMSAVSHSLANSLRRPATILAALAFAPAPLSPLNIAGIVTACVGAVTYGVLQ